MTRPHRKIRAVYMGYGMGRLVDIDEDDRRLDNRSSNSSNSNIIRRTRRTALTPFSSATYIRQFRRSDTRLIGGSVM